MSRREPTPPPKPCARCGREITWRRKWARSWEEIRYCSDRCRRTRVEATDKALERAILELLSMRARGATICPSEAARQIAPETWRDLLEPTREAARRLVATGHIEITQKGRAVDPSRARGPIRLRALEGRKR
ncbi:MAG: DUF2256 and DUF3253 domain-containing protein [Pseudomonadota bacterium]|nr:DUF2256 and DUF3253 domain-containing protein [Pseudomonadota bacterium]